MDRNPAQRILRPFNGLAKNISPKWEFAALVSIAMVTCASYAQKPVSRRVGFGDCVRPTS